MKRSTIFIVLGIFVFSAIMLLLVFSGGDKNKCSAEEICDVPDDKEEKKRENDKGDVERPKESFDRIAVKSAIEMVNDRKRDNNFVLLDIRTPEEFRQGHIMGAKNIDFYLPDFEDRVKELDKNTTYLVYCRSGNRSGHSMSIFKNNGFASVYDLEGGIGAWVNAGGRVQ